MCMLFWQALGNAALPATACSVPRSQRGGEIVEPLVSEQWFVRMTPLAGPARDAVASGEVQILPERFGKIYNMWLDNIKVSVCTCMEQRAHIGWRNCHTARPAARSW